MELSVQWHEDVHGSRSNVFKRPTVNIIWWSKILPRKLGIKTFKFSANMGTWKTDYKNKFCCQINPWHISTGAPMRNLCNLPWEFLHENMRIHPPHAAAQMDLGFIETFDEKTFTWRPNYRKTIRWLWEIERNVSEPFLAPFTLDIYSLETLWDTYANCHGTFCAKEWEPRIVG